MITLQQSAGNNNQSIWCLRLRGEGTNLVTLGDFSASTGWTATGDWAIGSGVATYTYVDDATGALYRTLSAAEAVSYILEYEVTNVSGPFWTLNAADLTVNGGGTYFFASSVKLDSTLGKHSIQLLGNAGGTELRFTITDVDTLDTISIDNVKIRKADNIVYLSTKDIELDNTYDGQVLNYDNYLSDVTYPSSIIGGGGTGSVTSFNFSISRHVTNEAFNSFFNEIYPATDAGYLVSRIVDFGICWEGATTDTEITWLLRGRVIDYNYEQRKLNLVVFQESELTNKEVPYYTIQKDFDNGVSYFTNAPENNYGVALPIIYGSFNVDLMDYDLKKLVPSILVDKRYLIFVQATHKLYTQNSPTYTDALYKYIDGIDSYMVLIPDNGDSTNTDIFSSVRLLSSTRISGELVRGKLFVVFKATGSLSDINDVGNIIDNSNSTYIAMADTEILSLIIGDDINQEEIGVLGKTAYSDITLQVSWQSNNGGNRGIYLAYHNLNLGSTAATGTHDTTTNTGGTWDSTSFEMGLNVEFADDATLPYTIDDLKAYEFIIENESGSTATSGILNIRQAVLILSNIIVSGYVNKNGNTIYNPSRSMLRGRE